MRRLLALITIVAVSVLVSCDADGDDTPTAAVTPTSSLTTVPEEAPATSAAAETLAPDTTASRTAEPALQATFIDEDRRFEGEVLLHNFSPHTDGGPNELDRVRITAGDAFIEPSLHPPEIAPRYVDAWRNIAFPPTVTGGPVIIGVCDASQGGGRCGGLDLADPEATTWIYRSDDLGRSWQPVVQLDGPYYVRTASADGHRVLIYRQDASGEMLVWPDMEPVVPPDGIEDAAEVLLPDGRLAWWQRPAGATSDESVSSRPDLVAEDGQTILSTVGAASEPTDHVLTVLFHADGSRAVVTWAGRRDWTLYEGRGDGTYERGDTIRLPDGIEGVPYTWLSGNELLFPFVSDIEKRSGVMVLEIDRLEVSSLVLPPRPEGISDAPYKPVAARPIEE